jgi:ABC-type nitrate/sulfonate/bicarbonate transport system substrate-binding protein
MATSPIKLGALLLLLFGVCSVFCPALGLAVEQVPAVTRPAAVVLHLKWRHQFQFAGYYAALEKGFYHDAGLDVTLVEASDYSESADAVLGHTADFGVSASDLVVMHATGKPVVVLAVIFQHSPLVLLARQNTGIDYVHDLVGKRVMLESHSSQLLAYLRDEGILPNQLVLYPHVFDPSPLLAGEVDAMSAYLTDEIYLLEAAGVKYNLFSPQSGGIDFYDDALFTTEAQLRAHPERVKAFVAASLRGWEYAFQHVDEVIDLIMSRYSQRHSRQHLKYEATRMRMLVKPDGVKVGYMNAGRWKHIADTYAKLGMIPHDYTLKGFIYAGEDRALSWRNLLMVTASIIIVIISFMLLSYSLKRFAGWLPTHSVTDLRFGRNRWLRNKRYSAKTGESEGHRGATSYPLFLLWC